MKILIADSFPESQRQELESMGHQITSDPALDAASLPGAIADNEVLVVRSTRVTPAASQMRARVSYYDPGIPIAGWFGAIDRATWRVGRDAP